MTIILKNGKEEIKRVESSVRNHSAIVMPAIEMAFEETHLSVEDLDQIIVVNGPGSFTGVRIGVTIAKAIAYTKNIPVKSITSLEMYGVSANEKFDIVKIEDSKGVYSALYKDGEYKEMSYQKKDAFLEYIEENRYKVCEDENIELDKIIDYLKDKEPVNPHILNPIYIKEIDALK